MMLMSDPSLRAEREATPPTERPLRVLFPGGLSPWAGSPGSGRRSATSSPPGSTAAGTWW